MYFRRAAVLDHSLHFSGAGDGDDPRLLSHKPRQRDLCGCSVLLRRFGLNQIQHRLMPADAVLRKEFHPSPPISLRKHRVFIIGSGEESFRQWAVSDQSDVQFLQYREQVFRIPLQHGVDILDRCHRADRMGAADDIFCHGREAPMEDFSLFDKLPHHLGNILNMAVRIIAVQVIEVNIVCLEPPQGGFQGGADFFRPGVVKESTAGFERDAELGGDLHLIPVRLQCGPNQILVMLIGTIITDVDLCRVKESVSLLHGSLDHLDHFCFVSRRAKGVGHAHAAQDHRRYLQAVS